MPVRARDDAIVAGGVEWNPVMPLTVRTGWQTHLGGNRLDESTAAFTAGASISIWRGLSADYPYNDHGVLGATHRIALRLSFDSRRFAPNWSPLDRIRLIVEAGAPGGMSRGADLSPPAMDGSSRPIGRNRGRQSSFSPNHDARHSLDRTAS